MITIGSLTIPTDTDIFEDENYNNELINKINKIYDTLKNYIESADTSICSDGIGFYECHGYRGYDSHTYLEYTDETEFLVECSNHPQLPEFWQDLEPLTVTLYADGPRSDYETEVTVKPVFKNNQYLFIVKD